MAERVAFTEMRKHLCIFRRQTFVIVYFSIRYYIIFFLTKNSILKFKRNRINKILQNVILFYLIFTKYFFT